MTTRRPITALMLAAALMLAGAPALAGNSYGALAHSDSSGGYGWAVNHPSQSSANRAALHKCGRDCQIVTQFWNTCAAYAIGHRGVWGWATAETGHDAKRRAVANCASHGGGCGVKVWACAGE